MTTKEYKRAYYRAHPEKQHAYNVKWRKSNPEKVQAQGARSRKRYPEKHSARNKTYRKSNPEKGRALGAKRYARKIRAIPKWADFIKIEQIYAEAHILNLQVDHTVPLKSPYVCGLHWEGNLQLLTAKNNMRKGNRIWPDM